MRQARRVLGEACELWVRTGAGEDPGIAFCELATALALKRPGHDSGPAALGAGVDDLVNEVNEVVWESHCDLLAHPGSDCRRPSSPGGAISCRRTLKIWRNCLSPGLRRGGELDSAAAQPLGGSVDERGGLGTEEPDSLEDLVSVDIG